MFLHVVAIATYVYYWMKSYFIASHYNSNNTKCSQGYGIAIVAKLRTRLLVSHVK